MKLCSYCESPIDGKHHTYCRGCYAHYRRTQRNANPESKKRQYARIKAMQLVKKGIIIKRPCSCGNPNSQMHHPDYDKFDEVVWYCKKCHDDFHVLERRVMCALH
jgi:hypothetical protein